MAMKNKKKENKIGRRLSSVLRDNKGVETRALIYVIAGVALVASLGIAMNAISNAGSVVDKASDEAESIVDEYASDVTKANPCGTGDLVKAGGPYTDEAACKSYIKTDNPEKLVCKSYDSQWYLCKPTKPTTTSTTT